MVVRDFVAFQAALGQSLIPMKVTSFSPESFCSRIRTAHVDGMALAEIIASRHTAVHTKTSPDPGEEGFLKVNLQIAGSGLLAQDGKEAVLHPGDMVLYDTRRSFSLAFDDDSRSLVLMLPRTALDLPAWMVGRLAATTVSGRSGVGKVVVPLLAQLAGNLDLFRGSVGARLAYNVRDLLATTLSAHAQQLADAREQGRGDRGALLSRVLDYIETNLGSEGMGPHAIAAAHFVSTRHLHGLFQAEGTTVATWVRERRLERCRRDLRDPSLASRTVSEIGRRWGFGDSAHFSRVFKTHTGCSPTEFRLRGASH